MEFYDEKYANRKFSLTGVNTRYFFLRDYGSRRVQENYFHAIREL